MEYRAYGFDFPPIGTRMNMLEEGIQVVRGLLENDRTTFQGKFFQVENATCYPKPVQARPRIWIGGIGEKRTLRLAARYADGWNAPYISPEQFREKSRVLDEWCEKEGRDPATILRSVNLGFYCGTDGPSVERNREKLQKEWGPVLQVRGGFLAGKPSEMVDMVAAYAEAGACRINIALRPPIEQEAVEAWVADVVNVLGKTS